MFQSIITAFAILRGCGNFLCPQVGHFLIWQGGQLNVFLWISIILGNFAFLKNRGNFSSPQAGLARFLLHFSNSATCQTMPVGSCPISCHAREAHTIFLAWKGLLGNCPGPWAVATVDIWTLCGNFQGLIHETDSIGWLLCGGIYSKYCWSIPHPPHTPCF